MADNADTGSDAQITFKVKTSSDSTHTITMAETASVLDLKNKLAGEDLENIPVDRQRLIYSGRVMKNDDTLATYKIKPNNTIHMVKSAASNPSQPASTNTPTPPAVPTNMASGTANNPLAGLTGARYAGHQVNLPGMDMFGPDGGMGPPMDEERMARMMSDPNVQQTMNEALNNPDFVNMLIDSNPMLRNLPNARELITSPFMRQMMSNPTMLSNAMRMQRGMRGGESAFPAPGATDSTPQTQTDGDANGSQTQAQGHQNPFLNPFSANPFGGAGGSGMSLADMMQSMNAAGFGTGAGAATGNGTQTEGQGAAGAGAGAGTTGANPQNPFAALFPAAGANAGNPFNMSAEQLAQMTQMMRTMGGDVSTPPAPADNRPPEERYEEQLRQLNDMGFFDFERNVAALRRSGGSVQGAIEHLLSGA